MDTNQDDPVSLIEVRAILGAHLRKRLGHSLILSTAQESRPAFRAKVHLVVQGLLCESARAPEEPLGCGKCESCRLLPNFDAIPSHPDAMLLASDTSRGYSIDAIRALSERFHLSRSLSPNRVAIIPWAELLSAGGGAAGNAFLKLLEEPRPDSYILLLTDKPDGILATLRSRSQHYRLRTADGGVPAEGENWSNHPTLAGWEPWRKWVVHGAPPQLAPESPADRDEFWKDRDAAVAELEEAYLALWAHARLAFGRVARDQGLGVWDFFRAFETLIASVRNFANPSLQWLSFRSRANLGFHGNH